jgi:hypothetical protein
VNPSPDPNVHVHIFHVNGAFDVVSQSGYCIGTVVVGRFASLACVRWMGG